MTEIIKPKYKFVEVEKVEGVEEVTPIKRKIAKTMEITEEFSAYDAIEYVAKMKKGIADKEAEIEGLRSMIKAYEDELEIIENELSVQAMEADYQKEIAKKNEASPENQAKIAALKEELLRGGNFVEKDGKDL